MQSAEAGLIKKIASLARRVVAVFGQPSDSQPYRSASEAFPDAGQRY
jgi:hypothetical protein